MERLFLIVLYVFDSVRDVLETWFDKRLSLKEKISDTFVELITITLGVIAMIKLWSIFG